MFKSLELVDRKEKHKQKRVLYHPRLLFGLFIIFGIFSINRNFLIIYMEIEVYKIFYYIQIFILVILIYFTLFTTFYNIEYTEDSNYYNYRNISHNIGPYKPNVDYNAVSMIYFLNEIKTPDDPSRFDPYDPYDDKRPYNDSYRN